MMNTFTTTELDQLITDYQKIAHSIVSKFTARYTGNQKEYNDLYAECMLALMEHLHRSKTLEEARHFQIMDMIHAMCVYLIKQKPLTYPKRTTQFKKYIRIQTIILNISCVEYIGSEYDTTESIDSKIDRDMFMETLTEEQQEVLTRRLHGDSMQRISTETGISYTRVKTIMKHVRQQYQK